MTVYFISGHRNITKKEFQEHYSSLIDTIISLNEKIGRDIRFVVGDYVGVDIMAQKHLNNIGFKDVTVYHMFKKPMNSVGFPTIGGFKTDEERDSAMTMISDYDIAWVREGMSKSGTQQNIDRRERLKGSE